MNKYHATPYDISATGFYFKTYEDYLAKAERHTNKYGDKVEEYEIQFIEGENYELFNAFKVNQATLNLWFDEFEDLDKEEQARAIYLLEYSGYETNEILNKLEEVHLFEGTPQEYAEEYVEDTGLLDEIPEHLRSYFDVERFANDMLLGGDICEVQIMNTNYVVQEG